MILISDYAYKPILRIAKGDTRRETFNLTPLLNKTGDTLNNLRVSGEGVKVVAFDYDFYTATLEITGQSRTIPTITLTLLTENEQVIDVPITVYVVNEYDTGTKPLKIPAEADIYGGVDDMNAFHEAVESLGS